MNEILGFFFKFPLILKMFTNHDNLKLNNVFFTPLEIYRRSSSKKRKGNTKPKYWPTNKLVNILE